MMTPRRHHQNCNPPVRYSSQNNKLQLVAKEQKGNHVVLHPSTPPRIATPRHDGSTSLSHRGRGGYVNSSACLFRFLLAAYAAFVACCSFWKSSSSPHKPPRHAQEGSSTSNHHPDGNNNNNNNDNSHILRNVMMPPQRGRVVPRTARAASPNTTSGITTTAAITTSITTSTTVGVLVFDETPQQLTMLNKVFCNGKFGLGHRLSKLAAAYHLTCHVLHLPRLQVHWGSCNNNNNNNSSREEQNADNDEIFASLFGSNRLQCPLLQQQQQEDESEGARSLHYQNKTIVIRNDVIGYYAGQAYKNAQVPIDITALTTTTPRATRSNNSHHDWLSKLDLDTVLFQDLLHHFCLKNAQRIQAFQQEHEWKSTAIASDSDRRDHGHDPPRLVIGLHIRAGNGEQDHFQAARRNSLFFDTTTNNATDASITFANQLASLIQQLIQHHYHDLDIASTTTTTKRKAPLVFLATDTAEYIPLLQNAFARIQASSSSSSSSSLSSSTMDSHIRVVAFPQERVPAQRGVSYQQWTQGESCRNGWRDSMMDMAMLAQSDVVIAATRSTFTQILPQALVWKTNNNNINNNNNKNNIEKKPPRLKFCQVGRRHQTDELIMSCFATQRAWLFGPPISNGGTRGEQVKAFVSQLSHHQKVDEDQKSTTIVDTIETTTRSLATTAAAAAAADAGVVDRHGSVVHKILVHLPDVEPDSLTQQAQRFLQSRATAGQTFAYGRRIATKYRGKGNEAFRADWTSILVRPAAVVV